MISKRPKSNPQVKIDFEAVPDFTKTFPVHVDILSNSLATEIDTTFVMDIVVTLRNTFLSQKQLLLSVFDLDKLYRIYEGTYSDVRKGHEQDYAHSFLDELSQENLCDIKLIKGVLFSTKYMSEHDTLKMSETRSGGHFVYFEIELESATVNIVDTLNTDFSSSPYLSERPLKNLCSFITRVVTGSRTKSFRTVQHAKYRRTSYVQRQNECGVTALLNLVLSIENSPDFLTTYSIENYSRSIDNCKSCLRYILYHGHIPYRSIKITL